MIPGAPQEDADAPPKKRGVGEFIMCALRDLNINGRTTRFITDEILPGTSSTEMCKLMVDYLISEGYQEVRMSDSNPDVHLQVVVFRRLLFYVLSPAFHYLSKKWNP